MYEKMNVNTHFSQTLEIRYGISTSPPKAADACSATINTLGDIPPALDCPEDKTK
jgi:hypothetical protein